MTLNPKLADAVAIFTALGWADAPLDACPTLPLGTAEQQRTARSGLSTGDWGEERQLREYIWRWVPAFDVDAARLALFAIRVGVSAARALALLSARPIPADVVVRVVSGRGDRFVSAFVAGACRSASRLWGLEAAVVTLVATGDEPVPASRAYVQAWLGVIGQPLDRRWAHQTAIDPQRPPRLTEHLQAATELGMLSDTRAADIVATGVARDWLGRAQAVELGFTAMELAQRPSQRQRWSRVLIDDLALSDVEILAHANALVPVLAASEPVVVERFAPSLIAGVHDDDLVDVGLACLMVSTLKAQRTVLVALGRREPPDTEVIATLGPRLVELARSRDRVVSRAAAAVLKAWHLEPPPSDEVEVAGPEFRAWWRPTPPVWTVPEFSHGPVTIEALTGLAGELVRTTTQVVDVTVEAFLAVANALARHDPADVRTALSGVAVFYAAGLEFASSWISGRQPIWALDSNFRVQELLAAREFSVYAHLGEVPCLLSEPSTVDLRVSLADLVARLDQYACEGASASEADLLLALARLNLDDLTALTDLNRDGVPVVLQSGEVMARPTGVVVADYVADPLLEPQAVPDRHRRPSVVGRVTWPASLADFPRRISDRYPPNPATLPGWGDGALRQLTHSGEGSRDAGRLARQVARRASALPPGGATNLLGVLRSPHPAAADDVVAAVSEAWQRGILRPGVADVRLLDWTGELTGLASLASSLTDVADLGVLSVIWPVLDDLLAASHRDVRLAAGTAEVVEAMVTLLPEVREAINRGTAPLDALALPGVRALASREGKSRAVTLARTLISQIPDPGGPRPTR
ncbi:MAG: hypothetical protein QM779_00975 [Propionicimonas sp.]|uniref:hypothetical protein n=1 Tax=Propionicimonas sp. TaxID=1955623 RepID=UPI003D119472